MRSAGRPALARWTLRRRLVGVLVLLLAGVAAAIGIASTLALRGSLLEQVDTNLLAANQRAMHAPSNDQLAVPPFTEPSPSPAPSGSPSPSPTPREDTPGRGRPFGLRVPGQDVGTINLDLVDGVVSAGYLDVDGNFHRLTDEQALTVASTVPDGVPRSVAVEGLGLYRVVATSSDGTLVVTGLPLGNAEATVSRFVTVEVVVALLGLALAAVAGTLLVRRELRPLDRVAATAARVSELPLDRGEVLLAERVPEADTDTATEVGKVGAALNQLLGHVERALAARHESETQVLQFVADASHELRTPLASIRGYAELVRRLPEEVPEDALRAMARVESEARRMTGLVEDMLLLARLDAGRDLERHEVDLVTLVVDAVADAHVAGPDHGWHLDLAVDQGAGHARGPGLGDDGDDEDEDDNPTALVLGDDARLRQVLANLLSNARVHTPPGTQVTVRVRHAEGFVTLQVEDDGPGIPEPLRSRLFQRFARGDASRNRAGGSSTGLGLAIAHAVVVAHGGTIAVDATPGHTVFTVRLPAAP